MGTKALAAILARVSTKLFVDDPDDAEARWTTAEHLADYNSLKNTIVGARPELGAQSIPVQLIPGTPLQVLPDGGIQFKAAPVNLGANGATRGATILPVDKDDLDHCIASWQATPGTPVESYSRDDNNPLQFWIYPQPATAWWVQVDFIGCFQDVDIADIDDPIALPDSCEDSIFYGLMAMAYAKNMKAGDTAKTAFWQQLFNADMGLKASKQVEFKPAAAAQEQRKEK